MLSAGAFLLFLFPWTRKNPITLNLGAVMIYFGVYIEKGMGLIIPGFIPSTLGEIYEYTPTWIEKGVALGIWALGALIYTLLVKFAIPIYVGKVSYSSSD